MTDETAARLAQIRAREQAATPGPWTWTPGMIQAPGDEIIMWPANIPLCDDDELDAAMRLGTCGQHAGDHAEDNLAFLAAAREDVPWLLNLVDQLRASLTAAEASIVIPDPLNLPAYAWGESVTWNQGRILVPLTRDDQTVADLVLDEDAAGTLSAMLDDAAGHKPPDCPRCFDRGYVPDWSRGLSAEHGEPGKKPCPDCQGDAVARETAERTPPGGTIDQ